MQSWTRQSLDGSSFETVVIPEGNLLKAEKIREGLAQAVLCLLVNSCEESDPFTEEEYDWAVEALQWISWNAGRSSDKYRAEGVSLLTLTPPRGQG